MRRTWWATLGRLIGVIVALGAVALAATQYQRSSFDRTTAAVERGSEALAALNSALQKASIEAPKFMYSPDSRARQMGLGIYGPISEEVTSAFEAARAAFVGTDGAAALGRARTEWAALDHAIRNVEERWEDGSAPRILASGGDPFEATVWMPYSTVLLDMSDVQVRSVDQLRAQVSAAAHSQSLVVVLVLAAIGLALAMGLLSTRGMSRRVLRPIIRIRRAAVAMRDVADDAPIDITGAAAELQDLAETLLETATTLRTSHRLLHDQAHRDPLTGLANRSAFSQHIESEMARGDDRRRVGMLFVDLDDFKEVNDTLGHVAGDELLRIIGERLRSTVREDELVARLGGDEFAISISGVRDARALVAVAERIISTFDEPVDIGGSAVDVSCSIGIALAEPGEEADKLLGNADFAMYMAKGQGKRRFEVFAPTMYHEMLGQMEFKRELAVAADLDQLELHYQPVMDLDNGEQIGVEALVRWHHPTRGLLPPAEFIGLAEETGDIVRIGEWILGRACRDLTMMHDRSDDGRRIWMSVNVSAVQLASPDFVDTVAGALRCSGLPGGELVLEITERVAMTDIAAAVQVLVEVRALGVHVALDDFGVGISSLRLLDDLPVDVLKIDRSFVIRPSGDSDSMLQAIISMACSLNLQVIAEGIEEPEHLARLRAIGAPAGQGYLFARPMPLADAMKAPMAAAGN